MADATIQADPVLHRPASPPRLRLVRGGAMTSPQQAASMYRRTAETTDPARLSPITSHDDPRWVLAVMAADAMEGALLTPEKRRRLIDTGQGWGLSPFDANLVIALVQDQARRGVQGAERAAAAEPMLRTIAAVQPPPRPKLRGTLRLIWLILGLLGLELTLLAILLS